MIAEPLHDWILFKLTNKKRLRSCSLNSTEIEFCRFSPYCLSPFEISDGGFDDVHEAEIFKELSLLVGALRRAPHPDHVVVLVDWNLVCLKLLLALTENGTGEQIDLGKGD